MASSPLYLAAVVIVSLCLYHFVVVAASRSRSLQLWLRSWSWLRQPLSLSSSLRHHDCSLAIVVDAVGAANHRGHLRGSWQPLLLSSFIASSQLLLLVVASQSLRSLPRPSSQPLSLRRLAVVVVVAVAAMMARSGPSLLLMSSSVALTVRWRNAPVLVA